MNTEQNNNRTKGGLARAEALTQEERSLIALQGARARWGARATHKGNFKEEFGIDVECYVLDDEKKTAVISKSGMALTLGLTHRGNAFPRFLMSRGMQETVGAELAEKLANPLKFQGVAGGARGGLSPVVHGFDVTLLIDVCKATIEADDAGRLQPQQKHVAQHARIILSASAKAGIQNLVYKLAGYDATKEEAITAFKFFIRQEARDYEREFPPQLYEEWYRLYGLLRPERNKPWKFKHLTLNQVYRPLARSNGKILELTKMQRSTSDEKHKKLHQFLSEIGVKALRQQLGQLLGIAQVSNSRLEYEKHISKVFGEQYKLDL